VRSLVSRRPHPLQPVVTPAAVICGAILSGLCVPHARAAFTNATGAYGLDHGNDVSFAASFVDYDGDGDHDP